MLVWVLCAHTGGRLLDEEPMAEMSGTLIREWNSVHVVILLVVNNGASEALMAAIYQESSVQGLWRDGNLEIPHCNPTCRLNVHKKLEHHSIWLVNECRPKI